MKCGSSTLKALVYAPLTDTTSAQVASVNCVMTIRNGVCDNATTYTGGGLIITGQFPSPMATRASSCRSPSPVRR
ncbi:MAG: hypothetical protein JWR63_4365 [Conexibacter sp.]|nr:hypothetical protein [Conexibacter sp.]